MMCWIIVLILFVVEVVLITLEIKYDPEHDWFILAGIGLALVIIVLLGVVFKG